jgi:hypothetical protein
MDFVRFTGPSFVYYVLIALGLRRLSLGTIGASPFRSTTIGSATR